MKKLLLIVVLVVLLVSVLPQQALASDDSNTVICEKGYLCQVLNGENLKKLKEDSHFWDLYFQQGDWTYEAHEEYVVVDNPFGWTLYGAHQEVPQQIVVDRDSYTAIPQMGIEWQKDRLIFHKPGLISAPEVPSYVPSNLEQSVMMVEEFPEPKWDRSDEIISSYYFDGREIMKWHFIVDVNSAQVVFRIISASFTFLEPVEALPIAQSTTYDNITDFDWTPGESLYVKEAYLGLASLETRDTWWRGYVSWTDGYSLQRGDGTIVKVDEHILNASRGCASEEHCYSRGFSPKIGQMLYVNPYTFWHFNSDSKYNTLYVYDVNPGVQIKSGHRALLDRRISAGQVDIVEGVVSGVHEVDSKKLIGLGGYRYVDLPISFMPPVGTEVVAYIYNDSGFKVLPVNNGVWPTMALVDKNTGLFWYFNLGAEDLGSFSPEVYAIH